MGLITLPPSKAGCADPRKQDLIDVVVKDDVEPIEPVAAEPHADALRDAVADRVRMGLALDQLNGLRALRGSFTPSDDHLRTEDSLHRPA